MPKKAGVFKPNESTGSSKPDCAMLVAGLAGMSVKCGPSEGVYLRKVHRDKNLARRHCRSKESQCPDSGTRGSDFNLRVRLDPKFSGIGGIDFSVAFPGCKRTQDLT